MNAKITKQRNSETLVISKSMGEIHKDCVEELLKRGEKVLQPRRDPQGNIWGYVKTKAPYRYAGTIYKNDKNGTFEILCDMSQYGIVGLKLEDIGFCDSGCWYEWMNDIRRNDEEQDKGRMTHIKTEELINELLARECVWSYR